MNPEHAYQLGIDPAIHLAARAGLPFYEPRGAVFAAVVGFRMPLHVINDRYPESAMVTTKDVEVLGDGVRLHMVTGVSLYQRHNRYDGWIRFHGDADPSGVGVVSIVIHHPTTGVVVRRWTTSSCNWEGPGDGDACWGFTGYLS